MVRPRDQKMIAIEKVVCSFLISRRGMVLMVGHMRKHQVLSRNRSEGKAWTRAFIVVSRGRNGQGRQSDQQGLGLFNNVSGFWGIETVELCDTWHWGD